MGDDARQVRIGDAERDAVLDSLKAHFAAGRLDLAELEERIDLALAARTQAELVPLTADLPVPAATAAPAPVRNHRPAVPVDRAARAFSLHVRVAVLLAAVFVLLWLVTLGSLSPLPPLALIVGSVLGHWGWRRWQGHR